MSASFVTLLLYIAVLTPLMLLGFYFARRKMFNPHHKLTMTSVVILNWLLIAVVMVRSFNGLMQSSPDFSQISTILPIIHMAVGGIAQLMATYLVLLMWTENTALEKLIPFRIKNIKTPMRITLSLWLITVLMGFGIYAVWYGNSPSPSGENPDPAITEEASDPAATEETENVEDPAATEESEEEPTETEEAEEPSTTEEPWRAAPSPAVTEQAPSASTTEEDDSGQGRGRGRGRGGDEDENEEEDESDSDDD